MAAQQPNASLLFDPLYCEEDRLDEVITSDEYEELTENRETTNPLFLLEQDLLWEDEELLSLFTKEKQQQTCFNSETESSLFVAREEAVEWMIRVNSHYGFSALTAILSINYLDRFLSSHHFQKEKPWMIQLAAVTCLSLAAKIEETQVPLLLDLQVVETKYVFDAKTIQKMELLILSALQWKMYPVTPISFLDHIVRRLGLKTHIHWEFLKRCERLLLSLVADSRFLGYLPSVLSTATMLHVIMEVEPCNFAEYQNQLLKVLDISKEIVNDCCQLIMELSSTCSDSPNLRHLKRRRLPIPGSPDAVVDASFSWDDSSNDSWVLDSSFSSSIEPLMKKKKINQEQYPPLPSFNRFYVDVACSPR